MHRKLRPLLLVEENNSAILHQLFLYINTDVSIFARVKPRLQQISKMADRTKYWFPSLVIFHCKYEDKKSFSLSISKKDV